METAGGVTTFVRWHDGTATDTTNSGPGENDADWGWKSERGGGNVCGDSVRIRGAADCLPYDR